MPFSLSTCLPNTTSVKYSARRSGAKDEQVEQIPHSQKASQASNVVSGSLAKSTISSTKKDVAVQGVQFNQSQASSSTPARETKSSSRNRIQNQSQGQSQNQSETGGFPLPEPIRKIVEDFRKQMRSRR